MKKLYKVSKQHAIAILSAQPRWAILFPEQNDWYRQGAGSINPPRCILTSEALKLRFFFFEDRILLEGHGRRFDHNVDPTPCYEKARELGYKCFQGL